ncbi:MAG: IS66 family transposase [Lachnospiraceae bacterium]
MQGNGRSPVHQGRRNSCTDPGSYASSGLAAHVMYYKYVMSMPLYRQEKDFEHLGVKISRTTMASWIIYCAENYFCQCMNICTGNC